MEPERLGDGPPPMVERNERDIARLRGRVEGGCDMPQVGSPQVAYL